MKVHICIPCRDNVLADFAFDLAALAAYCVGKGYDVKLNHCSGTIIPELRNNLAQAAVNESADWTFWLDTDMRFEKDALDRLLKHDKPIVGTNYVTREVPPHPTARVFKDRDTDTIAEYVRTTEKSTGLEQVDYIGFGCVLVKTEVFRTLEQPWFHIGFSTVNNRYIGEDVYFCMKAAAKNYPVLIDHDLSKKTHHIGNFEYRHDHVVEKDAVNGD